MKAIRSVQALNEFGRTHEQRPPTVLDEREADCRCDGSCLQGGEPHGNVHAGQRDAVDLVCKIAAGQQGTIVGQIAAHIFTID